MDPFLAFEVSQDEHIFTRGVVKKDQLPLLKDHVLIQVAYSDINYKDALAATKDTGVIRSYPKIPGIDLAGEIIESTHEDWPVGKQVIVTGYDLGVGVDGGFAQYQQVPVEWLVALPKDLSLKESMIFGTAGFTATQCVLALEKKQIDKDEPIFVTGATGGVGSIAIALLSKLGYSNITAISRKKDVDWLLQLGATQIATPEEVLPEKNKPLGKQLIAALIDTVGGSLLANLLPLLQYEGSAIICGNAGGIKVDTTVLPFILRGIQLIGIDSVHASMDLRKEIWPFLAENRDVINNLNYQEVLLTDLDITIDALLAGEHQGRTIVNMDVKI